MWITPGYRLHPLAGDRQGQWSVSHPPPRKLRRVLRLAGWNALLLMIGLALIGLAGEVWIRQTVPFATVREPRVFVPGVGLLWPPDTEIRWTNMLDFWTVQRTNRLGFLDREPPSPERAAESCHIAVIGDSFVEALSVSIAEKFHVRLEETAARELPHLDITTSAFGLSGTGQIEQLAFYDEYARPLRPRLVWRECTPSPPCTTGCCPPGSARRGRRRAGVAGGGSGWSRARRLPAGCRPR